MSKLFTVTLNRLGICASVDTHARYIQHRVEEKCKMGRMASLPASSFMEVSADNLDFIHNYSRVFSGYKGCSCHGTTFQIVQPKPTTLGDTVRDINTVGSTTLDTGTSISKRPYSTHSPNRCLRSPRPKKARHC